MYNLIDVSFVSKVTFTVGILQLLEFCKKYWGECWHVFCFNYLTMSPQTVAFFVVLEAHIFFSFPVHNILLEMW